MKTIEIIQNILFEERDVPAGKKYIALFDIDETLVSPTPNMFIYKVFPDGKRVKLTPMELSKENEKEEEAKGIKYDFGDFRNAKKVKESIEQGKTLERNFRMLLDHKNKGWEVAILTARGLEKVVKEAINNWAEKNGLGKSLFKIVHAVNDEETSYEGSGSNDKKARVIKKYAESFDRVKFIDDTESNLQSVRKLKLPNVIAVKAW